VGGFQFVAQDIAAQHDLADDCCPLVIGQMSELVRTLLVVAVWALATILHGRAALIAIGQRAVRVSLAYLKVGHLLLLCSW
jgi:hypothetical protein